MAAGGEERRFGIPPKGSSRPADSRAEFPEAPTTRGIRALTLASGNIVKNRVSAKRALIAWESRFMRRKRGFGPRPHFLSEQGKIFLTRHNDGIKFSGKSAA